MIRIPVQISSRSYEVLVERGLLRSAAPLLSDIVPSESRVFAVTSPRIRKHWGAHSQKSFSRAGHKLEFLEMPDGERSKKLSHNWRSSRRIWSSAAQTGAPSSWRSAAAWWAMSADFSRRSSCAALPVVQIPTTLLAQVDSAIGGKTGVNLASGKNLIGTFHQPLAVLVDPEVLATLPEREYRSGLFEAMKYGVIRNPRSSS